MMDVEVKMETLRRSKVRAKGVKAEGIIELDG